MDLADGLVGQAVHEASLDERDGKDGVAPAEKWWKNPQEIEKHIFRKLLPGNTNWRGRLSTVDLL